MRRMLTSCSCSCSCGDSCRFHARPPVLSCRSEHTPLLAPPCSLCVPPVCWSVSLVLPPPSLSLPPLFYAGETRVLRPLVVVFPISLALCVVSPLLFPSLCLSVPLALLLLVLSFSSRIVISSRLSLLTPPHTSLCLCPRVICAPDGGGRLFSAHCAVLSFVNHRPSHRVRHCPCAFISRRLLSSVCRRRCRRPALPFVFASFVVVSRLSCERERHSLLIDFFSPCVTGSCRDDRVSCAYGM